MIKMNWIVALILIPLCTLAQSETLKGEKYKYCTSRNQTGLGGYDPVTYFSESRPVKGKKEIFAEYDGVKYLFVSEKNKTNFIQSPDKYLPEYGGWCSLALAMGRATQPDYQNFAVIDNKLYLFERTLSVNGKELWMRNPENNKAQATAKYKKLVESGKIE